MKYEIQTGDKTMKIGGSSLTAMLQNFAQQYSNDIDRQVQASGEAVIFIKLID